MQQERRRLQGVAAGGERGRLAGAVRRSLPLALLFIQIVLVSWHLGSAGRLEPHRFADTASYLRAARFPSLEASLTQQRTLGYPAFLRFVVGQRSHRVPALQTAVYFASVVLFWWGVSVYGGSRWLALAAATPLVHGRSLGFANWLLSDLLAVSLTLATVALLLALVARPASVWVWSGLGLVLVSTYHTRPSTLFLVVWVPAVALLLRWWRERAPLRRLAGWALGLTALALSPFLLYATLRWVVVGHFGLVSFGGTNLIGIAASMIDAPTARSLPPDQAILANRIRRRRARLGWKPMRRGAEIQPHFDQYVDNQWQIALPEAERWLRRQRRSGGPGRPPPGDVTLKHMRRGDWVELNRALGELSVAVIRHRPGLYLTWLREALRHGLRQLFADPWVHWPLALIALSLPVAWMRRGSARREGGEGVRLDGDRGAGDRGAADPAGPAAPGTERTAAVTGLLALAASYTGVYLALLCLVSYPMERYLIAAAVLVPPALCAELFELWRGALAAGRGAPAGQ